MDKWRLLDTGPMSAADNMALDDVLLDARDHNQIINTVRFLEFEPPAILIGYHQDILQEVQLDYVKTHGIDVNRRITGGGAIYFGPYTLGWEIIASKNSFGDLQTPTRLFQDLSQGCIHALRILGIPAVFRPKNDIEVNGKKISGVGGVERGTTFLFQGTLLVDFDLPTMLKTLRIPLVKLKDGIQSAKERLTWVSQELGYRPDTSTIKAVLKTGFEEMLQISLESQHLSPIEKHLFQETRDKFHADNWIYYHRQPKGQGTIVEVLDKTSGGLVHVSLAIDTEVNVIKSALITGDFFVFPAEAILGLETALKFCPCDPLYISQIISDFFDTHPIHIPGVKAEDIIRLFFEALDKVSYQSFGFSNNEINFLFPITKDAKKVFTGQCDYLLLPYCAKPPSCDFRYQEGCNVCGDCNITQVYEISSDIGLKIITIQNFEHLMETLQAFKRLNVKGFIGCCCSAFYQKHRHDMEKTGVPGIIIDINDQTCYDLNQLREAYLGTFEAQTSLKLPLLNKVLSQVLIHKKKHGEIIP